MKTLSYRPQRTIRTSAEVRGVGFLTGADVRLRFVPAPADTGVVFVRADLQPRVRVPATLDQVTGSNRRTTLGRAPAQVELVEHVLAALAGLRIDNCIVELNAPEPPGLDGSAQQFIDALTMAGIVRQSAQRPVVTVEGPVVLQENGATLTLHPAEKDELKVSYLLDYGCLSPLGFQVFTQVITPDGFCNQLAHCRTFLLEAEALELKRQGLGARTTPADLLIFGAHGPIGNRLRFADEPARHKVLDVVGDLSLFGYDVRGHIVGYRSGHPLNHELVHSLTSHLAQQSGGGRKAA